MSTKHSHLKVVHQRKANISGRFCRACSEPSTPPSHTHTTSPWAQAETASVFCRWYFYSLWQQLAYRKICLALICVVQIYIWTTQIDDWRIT